MSIRNITLTTLLLLLSGCSDLAFRDSGPRHTFDPDSVAEIEPRIEPHSAGGNPKNYRVFGKQYHVMQSSRGFTEKGNASWYGTKFHGQKTSNGERYDMYAISAAHKTLPIPTYLEVTNLENGRKLIVRVNDRGPFHSGRIIDLSYAAAAKLGYASKGTARVEIRAIDVAQYQREKLQTVTSTRSSPITITPLQSTITAKATPLPAIEYTEHAETTKSTKPSLASPSTDSTKAVVASSQNTPPEKNRLPTPLKKKIYIQLGAFSNRANAEKMVKQTHQAQISTAGKATILPFTSKSRLIYRVRLGPFSSKTAASQTLQHLLQKNIGEPKIFFDS